MKVAIYCRLSEEDKNKLSPDADSNSIQNQKSMLVKYAIEQGWEVFGIYSDDDYAGADRRRPEFNRLIDDARQKRFDIILCKTQSRFTRELELVEKYIHGLFIEWGIRFVSIVDNADTANRGNKKSRQINGLVNEWYLEDMSENIKSVLNNKRENGLHIGSFALYGYKKDPERKGHLVIDEDAAAIVRKVFLLFSQGYGKTAIARMLNDAGVPNPSEYKRRQGLRYKQAVSKNGTLWRYSTISSMLKNEIYIGNMVQGKYGSISYKSKENRPKPKNEWYIVEATHEPIIDRDLWAIVQERLSEKSKPFISGEVGLFSGKARCASCGYVLRSSKASNKHGGRHYLQCSNRHFSKDSCEGAFISVERLEKIVASEICRLSGEYLDIESLVKGVKLYDGSEAQKARLRDQISAQRKKLEECNIALRELYKDKLKGIINENDFVELTKDFANQRHQLEKNISNSQKLLGDIREKSDTNMKIKDIIVKYTTPQKLTRELVVGLVDYVLVGKRIKGTRDIPVEIHWNF